ncbi:hypothetical protein R5M92_02705 [Halomonas sp. Bachu 37]|uniref:hypothetical protein n=1 Tax=Halomonas kashgarensis TaxID=3084920 RepID=UPI003216C6DB
MLWVIYLGVSLLVLLAVYLGLAFLPRLPRLLLTWIVAGAMWAPASFRLPLIEEGEFYTGLAPAAMVSAVAFLEHSGAALRSGLIWLLLDMTLGALVGVALWWWRRPPSAERGSDAHTASPREPDETVQRREPVIG